MDQLKNRIVKNYFLPFLLVIIINSSSVTSSDSDSTNVDILYRVILIGDAGEPDKDHPEPVLIALKRKASLVDSTVIIFLGDNIYPNGLPEINHSKRIEYERRLDAQINVIEGNKAFSYFIAGNHDWASDNDVGWLQVKRQADYISDKNIPNIKFAPLNACPGPELFSFGSKINLIFLDSQWWLQKNGRPRPEEGNCNYYEEDEIISSTDSLLKLSKNQFTIIAAHHPLSTHGQHGGHFTWKEHIFPLTEVSNALWIPLPIIGSIYPLARIWGISSQDISSSVYENYISKMENVLSKYSGVVYASGHEHSIQIIDGVGDNTYVVSGGGIYNHTESIGKGEDTILSGEYAGFVVIDLLKDDRTMLSVMKIINLNGDTEKTFTMWLNE